MLEFDIAIDYKKRNVIVHRDIEEENLEYAVEGLLGNIKSQNIAVWFNPNMSYGEIIILDDDFQEEEFIKITQK